MTLTKVERKPSDPLFPGLQVDQCVSDVDDGVWGEICDASRTKRATAIDFYCGETGYGFSEVSCTVAFVRLFDRQDGWDYGGQERWFDGWLDRNGVVLRKREGSDDYYYVVEDTGEEIEEAEPPKEPPSNWEPYDNDPAWEFCKADTPGAIKVWHCTLKDDPGKCG